MKITAVPVAEIIKLIGRTESSLGADWPPGGNYIAESLVQDLREAIGLDRQAIVRWDDDARGYIVIDAKKAVARANRRGR